MLDFVVEVYVHDLILAMFLDLLLDSTDHSYVLALEGNLCFKLVISY